MFGQNLQVDISKLPIAQDVLNSLATEMNVNCLLGLTPVIPLEDVNVMVSHGAGNATPKASSLTLKKKKKEPSLKKLSRATYLWMASLLI